MTKDQLLELVTREDPFSAEEQAKIQVALSNLDVAEVYAVLLKANEIGNEPQRELMGFLSKDTALYERISEFVRERNQTDEDESDKLPR